MTFYQNIGTPVRSSAKYLLVLGVVLLLVGMGYSAYLYNKARAPSTPSQNSGVRPEIPLAGSPRASGTLVIPAGGKSDLIPPLEGKYPEFTGFGKFLTHNVRLDGTECAFGEAGCVNGPRLKGYYISNESGATITVTFEFKPG